jgi:GTP-binding protein Era
MTSSLISFLCKIEQLDTPSSCPDNNVMAFKDIPEGHRSGFIGLIGRPNVGKSTLLNALLMQTIAPVSPRPQTTRQQQLGILTLPDAQLIFVDTPGLHKPHHKLGERMNTIAEEVLEDADVLLVMFDLSKPPQAEDRMVAEVIGQIEDPPLQFLALNKVDLLEEGEVEQRVNEFKVLLPEAQAFLISATLGYQVQALLDAIVQALPLGPRYYPEEDITDATEREIAAGLIRSTAMKLLRKEVPHAIAVRIDEFSERGDRGAYISATIFVERESQKGIVIGKGGTMVKQIGIQAREEIEEMSGRKIHLDLRVKVLKGWRNDIAALKRLGYYRKG